MKQGKLIPNLRFPDYIAQWDFDELKQLTSYVDYRGRAPEKSEEGIFLVTAKNIKKGFIDMECSKEYIPCKNREIVLSKGFPKKGDILFTTEAPLGNVAMVIDDNIALAQRVIKFRVNPLLLNNYLLYYMLCSIYQRLILKKAIGSTVLGISGKELHKTHIKFPNLLEQQKIADFLTSVDGKIQTLTRKVGLLKDYKKGVMQKIFKQEIRFKDDDGREFEDWEIRMLKEIGQKSKNKNREDNHSHVFTNSATQGIINQRDYFDKDIANQGNLEGYYIVQPDDFVYNPRISNHAPVGPMFRNKLGVIGLMSPLYSVFTINIGNLIFLDYFFESTQWYKYMRAVANYGARHDRMNVTNEDLMKMPILFPCLEEQTKIANFLSSIDLKIESAEAQLSKMKEWKKGLLQKMFV